MAQKSGMKVNEAETELHTVNSTLTATFKAVQLKCKQAFLKKN